MLSSTLPVLLVTLFPHVGGLPTPVNFTNPADVGEVADASYQITWDDADNDPTGKFYFYYKDTNRKPPVVDHTMLGGTMIPPAEGVMAMDAGDTLTWDTSAIPSGSYYLYGITEDPPLVTIFSFSKGPVTVRHPGDPLFPAVMVPEPDGIGDIVQDEYELVWRASGAGPMTADIWYSDLREDGNPEYPIATDVAMTDEGGGEFSGAYLWDLSDHESNKYYYVRIEVTDSAGRTHSAYSPSTLIIYRPEVTDGGASPFDGGADIDGGGGGGGGGGCVCATSGGHGGGSVGWPFVIAFVLAPLGAVATRLRRRRAAIAAAAAALIAISIGGAGCGGESGGCQPDYFGMANDESWFALVAAEAQVEVGTANAPVVTEPAAAATWSAADGPPTIRWTSAIAKPGPTPRHGSFTGDGYYVRIIRAGADPEACEIDAFTESVAWTLSDADWTELKATQGQVEIEITSGFFEANILTEGPYRPAQRTTVTIGP